MLLNKLISRQTFATFDCKNQPICKRLDVTTYSIKVWPSKAEPEKDMCPSKAPLIPITVFVLTSFIHTDMRSGRILSSKNAMERFLVVKKPRCSVSNCLKWLFLRKCLLIVQDISNSCILRILPYHNWPKFNFWKAWKWCF